MSESVVKPFMGSSKLVNTMTLSGRVVSVDGCKNGFVTSVQTPSPDGFSGGVRCPVYGSQRRFRPGDDFEAEVVPFWYTRQWVDKKSGEVRDERFPSLGFMIKE